VLTGGEGSDTFGVLIVPNDTNEMVVVNDFTKGDFVSVEVTNPTLAPAQADNTAIRDTADGKVISIAGQDVALIKGPDVAQFDASDYRVLDLTKDTRPVA
jgi:hypothetical protein